MKNTYTAKSHKIWKAYVEGEGWRDYSVEEELYRWSPTNVETKTRRTTEGDSGYQWQVAKRQGTLLVRPHWVKSYRERVYPISYEVYPQVDPNWIEIWKITDDVPPEPAGIYPDELNTRDLSELRTLALAKANEAEVDLLTSLAELPETINMFKGIAMALVKPRKTAIEAFNRYKSKTKLGKTKEAIDDLTSSWLAYRYGIMPAYLMVEDFRNALEEQQRVLQNARESSSDSNLVVANTRHSTRGRDGKFTVTTELSTERRLSHLVKSLYSLQDLRSQKKWGINPATTMWELTTLSFVVDWAIQVGDYISALSPSCASQRVECASTFEKSFLIARVTSHNEYVKWKGSRIIYQKSVEDFRRHVDSGIPPLTIPVGLQMDLKRSIDGFALSWPAIKSALTRKPKKD